MSPPDRARREALDWARRIHDPDFDAWDAHVAWLEAAGANAAALDEALADLDQATAGLSPARTVAMRAANDDAAPRRRAFRAAVAGGALAAGVAALLLIRPAAAPETVRVATAAGRTDTVRLGPGATAVLAGGTALSYRRDAPRRVRLDRGEALFDVTHDAAAPFEVEAGDRTLRDVGTVFDVAAAEGRLVVGVRQGAVSVDDGGGGATVRAGRTMRIDADGAAEIRRTPPSAIGAWRDGRLAFDDASLSEVAAAVSSATGFRFSADPDVAATRFSGVVVLATSGGALARTLAGVTGLPVVRNADGWRIAVRR